MKEVLELLFGEHGINNLKDGGFIFFIQLVDQQDVLIPPKGQYLYDEIGNLIRDNGEGTTIAWTPYGKVRSMTKDNGDVMSFLYDASGNRIEKKVVTSDTTITTHYIRDASGNVMATYTNTELKEQPVYGSSRLGMYLGGAEEGKEKLGLKHYELSNHLGNVLAVITDNINIDENGVTASVASVTDYYPFGLSMEGRTYSSDIYRYGFNGKEKDDNGEWGQTHYDYGFRIYNPSIAKFLSVDPLSPEYPMLSPYQYASNNPIYNIDLDGLEGGEYLIVVEKLNRAKKQMSSEELARVNRFEFYAVMGISSAPLLLLAPEAIPFLMRGAMAAGPTLTATSITVTNWLQNPRNQQLIAEGGAFVAGIIDPNPAAQYSAGYGDEFGNFVGGIFRTGGKAALNYLFRSPAGDEFAVGSAKLVDGILSFDINATDKLLGSGAGKQIFQDAMNQFGKKVEGIKAIWTMSDNYPGKMSAGLKQFKEAYDLYYGVMSHSEAAIKAAKETNLYKLAKDRGFNKVIVDFVEEDEVGVRFLKE